MARVKLLEPDKAEGKVKEVFEKDISMEMKMSVEEAKHRALELMSRGYH